MGFINLRPIHGIRDTVNVQTCYIAQTGCRCNDTYLQKGSEAEVGGGGSESMPMQYIVFCIF